MFLDLKFHHIPVVEFEPPSIQQMHDVCSIVQQASLTKEVCEIVSVIKTYISILINLRYRRDIKLAAVSRDKNTRL